MQYEKLKLKIKTNYSPATYITQNHSVSSKS